MNKISRGDAVVLLCHQELSSLDIAMRESYILNWWGIDEEDAEFAPLSVELKEQILNNEEPPSDSENCKYDELILIALSEQYKGVTNNFLGESMIAMGFRACEVHGIVETLEICPCCKYRTLNSRERYDICGLCGWEDTGADDENQYSGPNHMTLGEAQKRFIETRSELPLGKWIKG